jgi:hypothetical protein
MGTRSSRGHHVKDDPGDCPTHWTRIAGEFAGAPISGRGPAPSTYRRGRSCTAGRGRFGGAGRAEPGGPRHGTRPDPCVGGRNWARSSNRPGRREGTRGSSSDDHSARCHSNHAARAYSPSRDRYPRATDCDYFATGYHGGSAGDVASRRLGRILADCPHDPVRTLAGMTEEHTIRVDVTFGGDVVVATA